MEKVFSAIDTADNGGRRRMQDRRILVSVPRGLERRSNWDRRSGYDRRLRRVIGTTEDRPVIEKRRIDLP